MSVVLDTTVVIDHLRARGEASRIVSNTIGEGRRLAASVLTRIEIRRGSRPHQRLAIDDLDAFVDWVPVDHEIAALAARSAMEYGRANQGIDVVDYVVAATAERLDAELWTTNVRHFPMFEGLAAPY